MRKLSIREVKLPQGHNTGKQLANLKLEFRGSPGSWALNHKPRITHGPAFGSLMQVLNEYKQAHPQTAVMTEGEEAEGMLSACV